MKRLLTGIGFFALLSGCTSVQTTSELTIQQLDVKAAEKSLQQFVRSAQQENGIYLYQDEENSFYYVFLNGVNMKEVVSALTFSDVEVTSEDDTLNIAYSEDFIEDIKDKKLANQLLYKIKLNQDYETPQTFKKW
ncbi:hypothetical protein AWM68_01935 [Fictibacillus phosphorivorans]|uniref:Lipoprotein n=1 Tax=Fictibacillus phosphorivorans TaxID=1221500 RepID=A0A165P5N1_9BACL|nr:hypothetical protein [Fictibacillus phosphorivorans]KZE69050.1 hypothetical protein AWM68_01935 [Fictibacillus phosphorivorans]